MRIPGAEEATQSPQSTRMLVLTPHDLRTSRKLHPSFTAWPLRCAPLVPCLHRYPATFISFARLKALGRLEPHETLRDQGQLTILDTHAALLDFVSLAVET